MAEQQDTKRLITLDVPPDVWQEGSHAAFRKTTSGRIENLGPSQPYRHPVTNEVRNQGFKYANITQTPFDMFYNIIPGMHPFQWDVASPIITLSSFALGLADGYVDNKKNEDSFDELNKYLEDAENGLFVTLLKNLKPGPREGIGEVGRTTTDSNQPDYNMRYGDTGYNSEFNIDNYTGFPLGNLSYGNVKHRNVDFRYGAKRMRGTSSKRASSRRSGNAGKTEAQTKWEGRGIKNINKVNVKINIAKDND